MKVASEAHETLSRRDAALGPVSLPSKVSHRWFLVAVFVGIGLVISTSFILYSLQPSRPPPSSNLVFSAATLVSGNASFAVQNASHGPYMFSGFRVRLVVNNFASGPASLGPNNSVTRIVIGSTAYRVVWIDADGDGAVSVRDSFLVSGDGAPLSPLSDYEFDLSWQSAWTSRVFWSTY